MIYCSLYSRKKVGDIKFESKMFSYLTKHKIYIDFNNFETEEEGSPGFLIELHPKLTNKPNLTYSLQRESEALEFEQDATKDNGNGEETMRELTKFVEKFYPNTEEGKLLVPKFKLQKGTNI